jgi:hypothetical protein
VREDSDASGVVMDEVKRENLRFTLVDSSILERDDLDCYCKLVYVMLCKFADSEKRCFPSRSTLAGLVGCSLPVVGRSIKRLEEIGAIEVVNRTGQDKSLISNLYIIKDLHTPSKSDYLPLGNVVTYPRKPGYLPLGNVVTPNYNHLELEPLEQSTICAPSDAQDGNDDLGESVEADEVTAAPRTPFKSKTQEQRFDEFWKAYPKKRSKGQAEKAWAKIAPNGTLFKRILDSLDRAKRSRDWIKDGGQYVPYPATWLNAKGWEDDYEEVKTSVKRGRAEPNEEPGRDFSDLYL